MAVPNVQVKLEQADADSDNEDDEDDDENDGGDRSDEKSQAKRIHKHAMKILKFKLYFEDLFPTDDDRGMLVYNCWMAGAKVTSGLDEDRTTIKWMFYHFKYDKKVCGSQ
jgi:hypothetical protein